MHAASSWPRDSLPLVLISDIEVNKPKQNTNSGFKMMRVPGTPDFMPPEIFVDGLLRYDTAIDIFSNAGIILYTITEEWPTPKSRERCNMEKQKQEIVSEVERRQDYLNKMTKYLGKKLRLLVVSCLNDKPELHPDIEKVSTEIDSFTKSYDNYNGFDFVPPAALHIQHKPSVSPESQVS